MITTGAEAASWALAAELSRRVGPGYRLVHGFPGGGQSDVLWFISRDGSLPDVRLNRVGSVKVGSGDVLVAGENWTQRLANGEVGVGRLADQVLAELPVSDPLPMAETASVAGIAAVLRQAALLGQPWQCLQGFLDHPHGSAVRSELFEPYGDSIQVPADQDGAEWSSRFWFLLHKDEPAACFDTRTNHLWRPRVRAGVSLPQDTDQASALAAASLAPILRQQVAVAPPEYPGLGLPAVLAAFNRKERFYLLGTACDVLDRTELHSPSLRLGAGLRRELHRLLDWHVPAHAWTAMDYHLNWLHAALQWVNGAAHPGQRPPLPTLSDHSTDPPSPLVTGTQEDADLIIAWGTATGPRLILLEAKGYGAWDNKQAASKVRRVAGLLQAAEGTGLDVRLVFASPRAPQKLDTTNWPTWAVSAEPTPLIHPEAAWLPLPVPGGRLSVERTDEEGRSSAAGRHWHITGP